MDKKKIVIITAAAIAVIAVAAAAIVSTRGTDRKNRLVDGNVQTEEKVNDKEEKQETSKPAEEKQNTETASEAKSETSEKTEQKAVSGDKNTAEAEKVTPTFMYFVSKSDAEHDKTNAMIEELKTEYGDKVRFDIVDIDENPDAKNNFPVDGQTPVLIMLNTSNDISALEFKCNDKSTLENDIKKAME